MTYRTFLRSARNFEEFANAAKVEQGNGLEYTEAQDACREYNAARSDAEISAGTKLEFEEE